MGKIRHSFFLHFVTSSLSYITHRMHYHHLTCQIGKARVRKCEIEIMLVNLKKIDVSPFDPAQFRSILSLQHGKLAFSAPCVNHSDANGRCALLAPSLSPSNLLKV